MSQSLANSSCPNPTNEQGRSQHTFNMLGENIVGLPSDRVAHTADVIRVIQMLEDSGISCCFVGEYALIYYGAGRVPKVSMLFTKAR